MNLNYKVIDTAKIVDYISLFESSVCVADIIQNSGADKLRVYPALFELEQNGFLEVVEREELGAPLIVRKKKVEQTTGNSGYFVLGAAGITFKVISAVFMV